MQDSDDGCFHAFGHIRSPQKPEPVRYGFQYNSDRPARARANAPSRLAIGGGVDIMFQRAKAVPFFVSLALAPACFGALTWSGCPDLASTDFKAVDIATRSKDDVNEPMKMAFDLLAASGEDAKGKVDVYFTERLGRLRKFDSKTGTVMTLATFPLPGVDFNNSSDGLLGIALDPAFKTNHYAFIYYTYISSSEKTWTAAR